VLAHHYTEAGQLRNAIPLWQKAGELAFARLGLSESISHLTKGLEALFNLPPTTERDVAEVTIPRQSRGPS